MENAVASAETSTNTPAFDPYACSSVEPLPANLPVSGARSHGLPVSHPEMLQSFCQQSASTPNTQYTYIVQHNASAVQLSSNGLPGDPNLQNLPSLQSAAKGETDKKKKGKLTEGIGDVKVKKPKKMKKVKDLLQSSTSLQTGMVQDHHQEIPQSVDLPFSDSTYHPGSGDTKHNVLCAKTAAPLLPSNLSTSSDLSSSSSLHSYPPSSSNVLMPLSSSLPPTPPTHFASVNSLKMLPDGRRQSVDSQDQPISRPGSRASTVSSSSNSEGRSKEPVDSIPLSKVLEIIEREKALGSSSPCKRRRTAKPQHIQEAEEEAKKFAASQKAKAAAGASLMQNVVSNGSGAQNCPPVAHDFQNSPTVTGGSVAQNLAPVTGASQNLSSVTDVSRMQHSAPVISGLQNLVSVTDESSMPDLPSVTTGSQKMPPVSVTGAVQNFTPVNVGSQDMSSVYGAPAAKNFAPVNASSQNLDPVTGGSPMLNLPSVTTCSQNFPTVTGASVMQDLTTPLTGTSSAQELSQVTGTSTVQNMHPFTVQDAKQNLPHVSSGSTVQIFPAVTGGSMVQNVPAATDVNTLDARPNLLSETTLTKQNLPTVSQILDKPIPDQEFCCTGCKKDGSMSSKNCEQKLNSKFAPSPKPPSDTSLKLADKIYQGAAHSHPSVFSEVQQQQCLSSQPDSLECVTVRKTESSIVVPSKLYQEADETFVPASQNLPAAETSKIAKPISSSYQQNGFHTHQETHAQFPKGFNDGYKDAFKHLKTTASDIQNASHAPAQAICTTATIVVSSVAPVSSVLSLVKMENTFSEEHEKYNSQYGKVPVSVVQNHLSYSQNIQVGIHTATIQTNPCSISPTVSSYSTGSFAKSPVISGEQHTVDHKIGRPLLAKSQQSSQKNSWSQNFHKISGIEAFLPQTSPPSLWPPVTSAMSPSPRLPGTPVGATSPVQPGASTPFLSHQNSLPDFGPLPPFGAFAGIKSELHNTAYGYHTGQFSGIQKQDPNAFLTKREAVASKKTKKKQKSLSHTQNTVGEHLHNKHQAGVTNTFTPGLKDRNVKPLGGNWSNMQQVMEDKSSLKPVSGDYPNNMKPSFVDNGDMKPLTGMSGKADGGLGTGVSGGGMMHSTYHQPPPSPAQSSMPSLTNMSPEEELTDRLASNRVESVPQCGCLGPNYVFNESIEGPYYTQLGVAKDVAGIRQLMEQRTGLSGKAVRIEKIHYTGKEGRSPQGCPIAKWIIRRSSLEEKYLCVARKRPGHFCNGAYIVVVIVAWEGVDSERADTLYNFLVPALTKHGLETDRRCGSNEQKTCACQGADLLRRGASFSFGCSWSMYFNGCKFARSHIARKFKLKDSQKEEELEEHLQNLATVVGPLYKIAAPDAYHNQVHFEEKASMCRLGKEKGRPFSGVTACVDFCAHSHKDLHNMQNGSTVVVTLTKHRGLSQPDDEQLHVLPMYVMDNTDENGSIDGQMAKVHSGALEILHDYPIQARMRAAPLTPKRRGRQPKKDSPAKQGAATSPSDVSGGGRSSAPATPAPLMPNSKDQSIFHSQDSSQSLPDSFSGNNSTMQSPEKGFSSGDSSYVNKENSSTSEDFLSQTFGPSEMYEKVWEYFYSNGSFPPQAFMEKWAAVQKQAMMKPPPQDPATDNGANHPGHQGSSSESHPSSNVQREAAEQPTPSSFPSTSSNVTASHLASQPLTSSSSSRNEGNFPSSFPSPMPANHQGSNPPSPFPCSAHSSPSAQTGHSQQQQDPSGSIQPSCDCTHPSVCNDTDVSSPSSPVMQPNGAFVTPTLGQGPDEPTFTMMDPTIVKCEWQDNKESFHDPGIGGVAIALCHGAVLFEVAKREMHATTGLKNPNRYQPTRISLVFYQHKNLNYYHHGYYEYERKLATQRQQRIEKLMEEGATAAEAEQAVKPGRKRKKKEDEEEEKIDFAKTSAAQYKYMWETTVKYSSTLTTDSIITRWIDPQPMVTGPYQRWV